MNARSAYASCSHPKLQPRAAKYFDTVSGARAHWNPVWVVVDGSTDGTSEQLLRMAAEEPGYKCCSDAERRQGRRRALRLSEALDARLQPCAHHGFGRTAPGGAHSGFHGRISAARPTQWYWASRYSMRARPRLRVKGRKISNWFTNLETLWMGIHDSLFGFSVYPIAPLVRVMRFQPWMRRFDFDVEAVVRLCWRGVRPINLPAKVEYFRPDEGGVSHFNYWRDNVLLDLDARAAVDRVPAAPTLCYCALPVVEQRL